MKFYTALIALILSGFLLVPNSYAIDIGHLNQESVVIPNRNNDIISAGLKHAFENTLIKISGNANIATIPNIQTALNKTDNYVQSYSFSEQAGTGGSPQIILHSIFDQHAINTLLTDSGQAIWSNDRPLTLIWINSDTDTDTNNNILSASDNTPIEQTITQAATLRGIPVVFPLMDIQDQRTQTQPNNTLSPDNIKTLLSRYNAQAILIGNLKTADGQWQAQWNFLYKQQPTNWMNQAASSTEVAAQGVKQIANMYANQLAVYNNKNLQNQYCIEITNIKNLIEYANLMKLLKDIPDIDQINVTNMAQSSVWITLTTVNSLNNLESDLTNSQKLALDNNSTADLSPSKQKTDLVLQWGDQTLDQASPPTNPNVKLTPTLNQSNANNAASATLTQATTTPAPSTHS